MVPTSARMHREACRGPYRVPPDLHVHGKQCSVRLRYRESAETGLHGPASGTVNRFLRTTVALRYQCCRPQVPYGPLMERVLFLRLPPREVFVARSPREDGLRRSAGGVRSAVRGSAGWARVCEAGTPRFVPWRRNASLQYLFPLSRSERDGKIGSSRGNGHELSERVLRESVTNDSDPTGGTIPSCSWIKGMSLSI
jgi:hypothetical protein